MKYLHFPEQYVLYELPFAKGLQYQSGIIAMEGGQFEYITTYEELEQRLEELQTILTIDDSQFGE
jgi:hypothetical protein